jgi:hypothetical protein
MTFTKPQKNPKKSNPENVGAVEYVPLFLSNDQEASCPERHEHDGRSGVVHHVTGKPFPQEHDTKQCSP